MFHFDPRIPFYVSLLFACENGCRRNTWEEKQFSNAYLFKSLNQQWHRHGLNQIFIVHRCIMAWGQSTEVLDGGTEVI